jgi:hypothetical protein
MLAPNTIGVSPDAIVSSARKPNIYCNQQAFPLDITIVISQRTKPMELTD